MFISISSQLYSTVPKLENFSAEVNMSKKIKILVSGDVKGNFKTLFARVNAINEKSGPFDFLFCVGDFFSNSLKTLEPYKNGTLTVSVPTYFLGPTREEHLPFYENLSECEICPNVYFLGKHGILSSNGIKIAYVSGLEDEVNKTSVSFIEKDVIGLRDAALRTQSKKGFTGVDMLLTSQWPMGVTKFDKNAKEDAEGSKILARLACVLKPRYFFSGLRNVFYERPPYKNCIEDGSYGNAHSTRFIGLASVGNTEKKKWLYAANLTPLSEIEDKDLYQSTTDETECPFSSFTKTKRGGSKQYFYDMSATDDWAPKKRKRLDSSEKAKKKFGDPSTCWFCLANSALEEHLVISIGKEMYVALAKGGLTPFHCMIIPIKHHQCLTELSREAMNELKKYKKALKKLFQTKDTIPVFFERNYKTTHLQLHVVPVPKSLKNNLKEIFMNVSDERGLKLSELPNKGRLEDFVQPGAPYFYVELPSKEKLFCFCQKDFPINFGRDILASGAVLNMPERVSWRDCVKTKEEEEKMAQNFKSEFETFDNVF